jgi:hypothetical protein
MGVQARWGLFGISLIVVVLSACLIGFVLSKELITNVIAVVWFAGAVCCFAGAWLYLLQTPCPRCHGLAFVKGSFWSGSTWGVLGTTCVHCGAKVVDGQ